MPCFTKYKYFKFSFDCQVMNIKQISILTFLTQHNICLRAIIDCLFMSEQYQYVLTFRSPTAAAFYFCRLKVQETYYSGKTLSCMLIFVYRVTFDLDTELGHILKVGHDLNNTRREEKVGHDLLIIYATYLSRLMY